MLPIKARRCECLSQLHKRWIIFGWLTTNCIKRTPSEKSLAKSVKGGKPKGSNLVLTLRKGTEVLVDSL